ncbi:A/G-specific adenine glycosylase [Ideonella livida]|uniref:Adenine DNA glycosylase n=1 Tax=Ideonella livida TaxID=2707176 RepID=A0A7C9TLT9_9BURK|nr:A/G-specific adenine glycosylase [Ideonella livida]NDY92265.1 A/G-specific adenine glycosylase [Ideonella livida]
MTPPSTSATLAADVVRWQRAQGRHGLPWQGTRNPYRVWLSEIMLQQTQVSTVLDYYPRFLARFPDVQSLAAASQDEVLGLWAGLGYYSRARHLHRCAQAVVADHGGVFPATAAQLQTLPGIGRSTAAAIAAFCHGERAAILDGNVKRVLGRALAFGEDLAVPRHERALWSLAQDLLPPAEDMPAYTQGLMDLGATVCVRRSPRCGLCPLAARCVALAQGQPEAYPVIQRKLRRGQRQNTLLWISQGERVWVVPRADTGIWAGLWSWPEYEDEAQARQDCAGWPGQWTALPAFTHVLTHLDWTLTPLHLALPPGAEAAAWPADRWPQGRWLAPAQWADWGLPAPLRRLLGLA